MEFFLSSDQLAIKEAAREFADIEMAPFADLWDKDHVFPVDTLKKAADLGFAAICVPENNGGTGLSRLESVIIFEELATACPSTAAYLSIHNMVCGMISSFGNQDQKEKFLPDLCKMAKFSSYCLTEPQSGSDAASLQTTATLDGNDYILNGTKAFISGGGRSDLYLCMVKAQAGITCLIVPKNTPGLSFGKPEEKLGWHSQPTTLVFFENTRVPIENRLGDEGEGFKIALTGLNGGRLNIAACSLGGAKACLQQTHAYMQERQQFKQKLSEFEALQFRFADMLTDLECARLMVYRAAQALDQKHPQAVTYCAMAKKIATDKGFEICNQSLQLHGGYGYIRDYKIERYFRDLRVHQILEGTNEIMRLIIAKNSFNHQFVIE